MSTSTSFSSLSPPPDDAPSMSFAAHDNDGSDEEFKPTPKKRKQQTSSTTPIISTPSKKTRKTPIKLPRTPSKPSTAEAWEPDHDDYILSCRKENINYAEIAAGLHKEYGVNKTTNAVSKRARILNNKTFEWTPELTNLLTESVSEYLNKAQNKYVGVNGVFQAKKKPDGVVVKVEAVVSKLKALEGEGKIQKLG